MITPQLVLWAMVATTLSAPVSPRTEKSLNGQWEYLTVPELSSPPKTGNWNSIDVPGTLRGYDYQRAWFRRPFTLPSSLQGTRIKIRFDGVKYNSRILVNGIRVGGCFNGYDAFEVDVTDAVRFDRPNELAVGCHDWTGVFSAGKYDFSTMPGWQRARRFVKDKVIAPIGGHYDQYGIWGDVTLHALPAVHVRDLFIKPSVRRGELVVEYTVANESERDVEVELRGHVLDQGEKRLALAPESMTIPAGGTVERTVRKPWKDAHFWSHEDPYLYHLHTELSTGDVSRTRFGFREFWIEGHRYILNGSKVNLLASSWWPPVEPMERNDIEQQWRALRQCGCVCFRTHTQPWRKVHYDVADEVGLLMIIEGPVWHDPYCTAYDDPTFWKNYAESIRAMIHREKNRPSVVMWSMGNEVYGGGKEKTKIANENLARIGRLAKKWDPTRPVYFESDGDPEGVADAIGMHYVHEYPGHTCWPNEAYWLDKPFHPHTWFGITDKEYRWEKEKPLYIGEFLWVPSGTPAAHTVFLGDEAYQDLLRATRVAKGESWKMQIQAFRHQEIGGMCPWTVGTDLDARNPLYRAHQYAYQPIAAYTQDYDRRFFAGQTVRRRVEVFNDVLTDSKLLLTWSLVQGGAAVDHGSNRIQLGSGEKQLIEAVLHIPQVSARTPLEWQLKIERNGNVVFRDTHSYAAYPRISAPKLSERVGLFDPKGETAKWFESTDIPFVSVDSLERVPSETDLVVIGAGAIEKGSKQAPIIGKVNPQRAAISDFVARGGRLLVLRQTSYTEGLFGINLTSHRSTMTFPVRPSHPALDGLTADDLKFWRGDNLVSDNELPRPASGAMAAIIVSGSATGISYTPLLERPLGRGCIIHNQLRLIEKAADEPAAAQLLTNLLAYLSDYEPKHRKTGVIGGTDKYYELLRNVGLRFDVVDPAESTVDFSKYSLLICRGGMSDTSRIAAQLHDFVNRGGNLLVHRPDAATLKSLSESLDADLTVQPYSGPVRRAEEGPPILESITREDLYWTVRRPGLSWAVQPPAGGVADGVFGKRIEVSQAKSYEIEDWELDGDYVQSTADGVLFASAGEATAAVVIPESGTYRIGIRARGTPCRGVYPIAQLLVDEKSIGYVQLDGEAWQVSGVVGQFKKGKRTITVTFINDSSNPPDEDRNLEVDKVYVQRDDETTEITFLTSPSAVAVIPSATGVSSAGNVVIDLLRWDTNQAHRRKAMRYAGALLTTLEADLTPRASVSLDCDRMTPQPDMNFFRNDGGVAAMNCNGYIKTAIDVAVSREYEIDVVASGTPAAGIFPLVEVHVDGNKIGETQLTADGWKAYTITASLTKGRHELQLFFVNDGSTPSGEDRNLQLDKVVFYND